MLQWVWICPCSDMGAGTPRRSLGSDWESKLVNLTKPQFHYVQNRDGGACFTQWLGELDDVSDVKLDYGTCSECWLY